MINHGFDMFHEAKTVNIARIEESTVQTPISSPANQPRLPVRKPIAAEETAGPMRIQNKKLELTIPYLEPSIHSDLLSIHPRKAAPQNFIPFRMFF